MLSFFTNDIFSVLAWWFVLSILGSIFWPFVAAASPKSVDKGYFLSKICGLLVFSYIIWLLCHLKIVGFSRASLFIVVIAAYIFIIYYRKSLLYDLKVFRRNWLTILSGETLFLLVLIFFSFLKTSNPAIPHWSDAFSDLAYINSLIRTNSLPPQDPWFGGEFMNYYYYGYYLTAFLAKLCGIPAAIAYNLMKATLYSLAFCLSLSLTANLLIISSTCTVRRSLFVGMGSSFLMCFGGNLHTLVYAYILPWAKKLGMFSGEVDKYFFVQPTRYVKDTINDFPSYSLLNYDLHPNGICIPISISLLMMAQWWLLEPRKIYPNNFGFSYWLILPGFLLSIIFMTNAWGFPIYSLAFMLCVFYQNLKYSLAIAFFRTISQGLFILVFAILFSFPFLFNFKPMTEGIGVIEGGTPLYQLLIYWGYQLFFITNFSIFIIFISLKKQRYDFSRLSPPVAWCGLLMVAGVFVFLFPEIFYMKDFYHGNNYRMNTVFKFWHEAFLMISCTMVFAYYELIKFVHTLKTRLSYLLIIILTFFIATPFLYPVYSLPQVFAFPHNLRYQGLDGASDYHSLSPNYVEVTHWLNKNVTEQIGILEAPGPSYNLNNVVSTLTGLPTILGWYVHYSLHHIKDVDEVENRRAFIKSISEAKSPDLLKSSLKLLNIKYIILGKNEINVFGQGAVDLLRTLGPIVFTSEHNNERIEVVELE